MINDPQSETASTRERIRETALQLFGEKGYDGVSMNELAEQVGVAKPSLYNYYRAKEDLLLDLVEEGMRQWSTHCMAPFERSESFEQQLAEHLRLTMEFAVERPHVVAVFHHATSHVQGALATRVEEMMEEVEAGIRERFHRRVEEALAAGELDAESPQDLQIFLGIFFHGLLFLQTNCQHQVGPIHERLDRVWRLLFRALSGREPKVRLS
jgi:AcrR family transcriptional regulator